MQPIIIPFRQSGLGRVAFYGDVSTADRKSLYSVDFKLDSGSDFTTINREDLYDLGYTTEFLQNCPVHKGGASAAAEGLKLQLRYITDVSIKLGDRELQGCRIYMQRLISKLVRNLAKKSIRCCEHAGACSAFRSTNLRNLFGCDILKYFNWEIDHDKGELRLTQRTSVPLLADGETPLHIYTLDTPL